MTDVLLDFSECQCGSMHGWQASGKFRGFGLTTFVKYDKKYMKNNCLICHSPLVEVMDSMFDTRFGLDTPYLISKCKSCNLEQTAPLPNQEELNALYERYYNFSGERNTRYTQLRAKFINSFLYRIWLAFDGDISFHLARGTGSLLDVGCNEGRGLEFYQNHGFFAEGLELNSKAAEVARSKGFVVHGSTLEGYATEKKYDVVVLSNVLEHSVLIRLIPLSVSGKKICHESGSKYARLPHKTENRG